MKALICGSGAIGIAIGASLIDSGVETTFFAYFYELIWNL